MAGRTLPKFGGLGYIPITQDRDKVSFPVWLLTMRWDPGNHPTLCDPGTGESVSS